MHQKQEIQLNNIMPTTEYISISSLSTTGAVSGDVITFNSATNMWTASALPTPEVGLIIGTIQHGSNQRTLIFNNIPSKTKRVSVMFDQLYKNGSSPILIQIGSGIVIKNYGYHSTSLAAARIVRESSSTTGFILGGNIGPMSGLFTLTTLKENKWAAAGTFASSIMTGVAGSVTLQDSLNCLQITTVNGWDTFTSGSVNIAWE